MQPQQLLQAGQTPTTIFLGGHKLKVANTMPELMEACMALKVGTMVPQVAIVIEGFWCQFEQTKAYRWCYGEKSRMDSKFLL
jgi:hypothetical protein